MNGGKESMTEKPLTSADRSERLWFRLKARAAELVRHGKIECELTMHQGQIVEAEIMNTREKITG
jgi:hypothetical protein